MGKTKLGSENWTWSLALSLGLICNSTVAIAQTEPLQDFATYTPETSTVRIDRTEAPVIDGHLTEGVWKTVTPITDFYQIDPDEGQLATEDMSIYILYDDQNLYIGGYVHQGNVEDIIRLANQRDGDIGPDDHVRVYLDPLNSRRDGYHFGVNANGARLDGIVENGSQLIFEWDTIWAADAKVVEDGWTFEIAIPFRSISYDDQAPSWGLQFFRGFNSENQYIRWSNIDRGGITFDFTRAGRLYGIEDVDRGLGLDVQTFGTVAASRDWRDEEADTQTSLEVSGNAYYKVTPSLTSTLTVNTDFSDTPLDERQVNTGRFSLFLPETRDFFLQDLGAFQFGGSLLRDTPNGRPFFSRRIGLVNGEIADIIAGLKLSGQLGKAGVGALTVRTDETETLEAQTLSVARFTYPLTENLTLGAIGTNGDPTGAENNSVGGVDLQYRIPSLMGRGRFELSALAQTSWAGGEDAGSYGIEASYPNDQIGWSISARQIDEGFEPALGFVNRTGIRDWRWEYRYSWRPEIEEIRRVDFVASYNLVTDLDNELETEVQSLSVRTELPAGDNLRVRYKQTEENITDAFSLPQDVLVPAGRYEDVQMSVALQTAWSRPLRTRLEVVCCDFFGGDYLELDSRSLWRPSKYFSLGLNYNYRDIDMPTGNVNIHVGSIETNVNITPRLNVTGELQYDNISEEIGGLARIDWEVRPGTELFFAIGHSATVPEEDFPRGLSSNSTSSIFRVGHTFRF